MRIVPVTEALVQDLGRNLRAIDKREIMEATGLSPRRGLLHSVNTSVTAYAALQGSRVFAIYGCAQSPKRADTGCPWLLGSPLLDTQQRRALITVAPGAIQEMHQMFPRLENYVSAENYLARRWLLWAGFQMVEHVQHYGVQNRPFIRFVKEVSPCVP